MLIPARKKMRIKGNGKGYGLYNIAHSP